LKKVIIILIFLVTQVISGQFHLSGVVIDHSTLAPIEGANILDLSTAKEIISDHLGHFKLVTSGNRIKISFSGYQAQQITISKDEFITISLIPNMNQLQEVVINSQSIPTQQKHASDAVSILTHQEIVRGNGIELHPILNKVPGVFMQSGTLNTNRITIRGIGSRNLFGTANIRAYFGDIPLTDGNGESSIEDLELATVSRIDIHKGPSSSSYGVGLGGTIILRPDFIKNQSIETSLSSSLGSYGLLRNVAKIGLGTKNADLTIVYSDNRSDGYRDNNAYKRNTLTVTSALHSGEKNTFSLLASYVDLNAGIPSSLNQEDFDNSPRDAAFTWGRSQGFEDVRYGILGFTWTHNYNKSLSQHTSLFTSFRNNYEPRPFNILEEKSNAFGIRSRIVGNSEIFNSPLKWTFGGELFFDFYAGKTFENLYEDFPIGTGSVAGNQISDLDEKRNYYRLNFGIHLNQTFFDIDDNFLQNGDSSGTFDFDPIVSPKLGANYTLNTHFIFFGNIAHGFSTPTTSETLLPDGEFNPNIKPEIGWNYEIGSRYKFLDDNLFGSISVYSLRVKNLLVSRRTEEGAFFAINAGKTIHNGIETALNYKFFKTDKTHFSLFTNTTINYFKFEDFVDLDNDFSGNDLTGVPSYVINAGIDVTSTKGFYGNLVFQTVGKTPANDQNTVYNNTYELLHGKIGFRYILGKHFFIDHFIGANNILDTKYASQLQINARGFGGNAPRYFYPGLPFNMYGGLNIKYSI